MKIPKKFRFMGLEYAVSFDTTPHAANPSAWACTNHKRQTIVIDPSMSEQLQEQTFIHELLHVIFFNMGLDQLDKEGIEEVFVNSMANGLYALLKTGILRNV